MLQKKLDQAISSASGEKYHVSIVISVPKRVNKRLDRGALVAFAKAKNNVTLGSVCHGYFMWFMLQIGRNSSVAGVKFHIEMQHKRFRGKSLV